MCTMEYLLIQTIDHVGTPLPPDPYVDQFEKKRKEKRERVDKNEFRD